MGLTKDGIELLNAISIAGFIILFLLCWTNTSIPTLYTRLVLWMTPALLLANYYMVNLLKERM